MIARVVLLIIVLADGAFAGSDGFCPPAPPMATVSVGVKQPPSPSNSDEKYAGMVTLLTVISDTGHVCGTRVLRGIGKQVDKETQKVVRQWRFVPAEKDGHPVPVVVNIEVNYWTNHNGDLVRDPPPPNVKATN